MKDHKECMNCLYANKPCEYENKYYIIDGCPGYHPLVTFKETFMNIDGKLVQVK